MTWWPIEMIRTQSPIYATIALDYLNDVRIWFNKFCEHLEPWQIVAYTLSIALLFVWSRRMLKADKPLLARLKSNAFALLRRLPWVEAKIAKELAKAGKDIEETIHKYDQRREFYRFLPEDGLSMEDIVNEAETYQMMGEFDYNQGRVSGAVYTEERKEHKELLNKIFDSYAYSNPLHPDVFPGCRKMEAEIVRIVCSMYHGGPRSCGTTTTGGTESILLACLAYRNRAYKLGIRRPEILLCTTAHAAFDKAAHLFQIRLRHIPVNKITMQVDIDAMRRAIGRETCMLVGSAPNFSTGTIDPIEEISRLGLHYGIPVHVDACLGGFLIPFMEQCDFAVKPFDFRLPGVTSISCDMHKYGFTPKGSSIIMYRDTDYLHNQFFCAPDWSGGIYATPTLTGSRCGANIAMTWATLLYYGKHGYVETTHKIIQATRQIRDGIKEINGLRLVGNSDVSVVAFSSDVFNIYSLSDRMNKLGWNLNTLQNPSAIHICATCNHAKEGVTTAFLKDLNKISEELLANPEEKGKESKTAAIYGLAASVPDKSLVEEVAFMFLDACYATPSLENGKMRTFSVQGRKLSMIGKRPQKPSSSSSQPPLATHVENKRATFTISYTNEQPTIIDRTFIPSSIDAKHNYGFDASSECINGDNISLQLERRRSERRLAELSMTSIDLQNCDQLRSIQRMDRRVAEAIAVDQMLERVVIFDDVEIGDGGCDLHQLIGDNNNTGDGGCSRLIIIGKRRDQV